jgi:hypothetical protein
MPRPAEIFFGGLTAAFIGVFALVLSPNGMTTAEAAWVGGTALALIVMFAIFDVAAIRRPSRREPVRVPLRATPSDEPEPLEILPVLQPREIPLIASRKHESYLGGMTPFERLSATSQSTGQDPEEASDLYASAR